MKGSSIFISIAAAAAFLSGCSGQSKAPNFYSIMDRTVDVIIAVTEFTAEDETIEINDELMTGFTALLHEAINTNPKLYATPMGLAYLEDASFKGFDDKNGDNVQDTDEEMLFTLEIDAENNRLVCTDYTGQHHGYRVSGAGFFAGALVGAMMNRQRGAGVNPGRFSGASMRSTSRTEMAERRARSRARSGGSRSGK